MSRWFAGALGGFCYNSGTNPDFLSVEQLRDLIRQHVDPSFLPI